MVTAMEVVSRAMGSNEASMASSLWVVAGLGRRVAT